jgi:hypothetical protein
MTWSESKAVAAEVIKNLRSRFSEPEIRLVLRALSRLHHKKTPVMKFTAPILDISGRKYVFVEEHKQVDALLAEAGLAIPKIPDGCNTVIANVCLRGQPALAINQTGFKPELGDNECEVNGCMLLILLDETGEDAIDFGLLEAARQTIMKS